MVGKNAGSAQKQFWMAVTYRYEMTVCPWSGQKIPTLICMEKTI